MNWADDTRTAPKKSSSNLSSSLLGTSPGSSFAGTVPTHKRDGSTGDASLGTSAPKVRMLNGRVYGARRASEAAAAQEVRRREMEPAFVEWGSGQRAATRSSSNGFDDDDGGGMSWVRKRREERERREREAAEQASKAEAEAEAAAAANADADTANGGPDSLSSSASSMSPPLGPGPQTPHGPPAELVAFPPTINVVPPERKAENQHVVQAIAIPGAAARGRRRRSDDFDDDEDGDDDDGDFDDDDGEDDGDFENDDEDEAELAGRFTASAAGVEILSRHKK
jgi:hypothetical protein